MTNFFEETEGVLSMGRLLSFMAVVAALIVAFFSVYTGQDNMVLIGALLGYGFAQKVFPRSTKNQG